MTKPAKHTTIKISNLLPFCRQVQLELQTMSQTLPPQEMGEHSSRTRQAIILLSKKIGQKTLQVKKSLKKKGFSPARLPLPSYRAFIWLSFLENERHLMQHMLALQEFRTLGEEVINSGTKINLFVYPTLELNIFYLPYIYQNKVQRNHAQLVIHEAMITAPHEVKKELMLAALKGSKPALRNLKKYCSSRAYYEVENLMRGGHGAQGSSPSGRHIDLVQVFDKVNRDYFGARLEQPQLCWSTKRSYRRLGTYSAQLDQVTISRTLDNADYPLLLVEYIMYHELLHKKVGVQRANSGKHNHNKAFKDLEKRFQFYEEANQLMKTLAPATRRGFFNFRLGR